MRALLKGLLGLMRWCAAMLSQEGKLLWLGLDWATTELPASDTEDGTNKNSWKFIS